MVGLLFAGLMLFFVMVVGVLNERFFPDDTDTPKKGRVEPPSLMFVNNSPTCEG